MLLYSLQLGEEKLMGTQPTFAELEYNQKKKTTHRERFLARMDALIPWGELEAEMARSTRAAARGGRPTRWR